MVVSTMRERPLVGRQAELALLLDRLKHSREGRAHVVFVDGEPGIGKTRLLEEMATIARPLGAIVLRGGATEASGMPPYAPLIEALGTFLERAPAEVLLAVSEQNAAILAAILPEIRACLKDLPRNPLFPKEQARLRLYQAAGEFLAAIPRACDQEVLLLILDDLPWADAATLDLLHHVARRQQRAPLLLLTAGRRADAERPPFEAFLHALTRLRVVTTIHLAPLNAEETDLLAFNYLGAAVDKPASHFLHSQSEGNPFFTEELLQDWLESGCLSLIRKTAGRPARWSLALSESVALPATIASAVRQRLARLPGSVVDRLRHAAVIGRTFSAALLAQLVNQNIEDVEELLLDATRVHLLRSDREGSFAFVHDKIRECLYAEVSSARRQRLHHRLGLILESTPYADESRRLAELAFHFARSPDRTRGVTYARQSAEHALYRYAPQEAISHCRSALELLERTDRERGDLLLLLGDAALQAAEPEQAAEAYAKALVWFQAAGDLRTAARAARGCGLARRQMGVPSDALRYLDQSIRILAEAPDAQSDTVQVLVDRADLLGVVLGCYEDAVESSRRALDLAHQLDEPTLEAATSRTAGFLSVLDNDFAAGLPLLEKALALDTANDDPAATIETCACLAQAYGWLADVEKSRGVSLRREELARKCTQPYALSYVYAWLAFLAAMQGDWSSAGEYLRRADEAVRSVPSSGPQAFLHQVQGYLAYQRGDYTAAECLFRESTGIFGQHDPGEMLLCLGPLGLAQIALGRTQAAQECMAEQERLLDGLPAGRLRTLSAHGCLALMSVLLGDVERAASYYKGLLACEGQHHWFLVDRILGQISVLRGEWSAADRHLQAAEETARIQKLRPELGRVLAARADLELGHGESGAVLRAHSFLRLALALFENLELDAAARAMRRRIRDLPREFIGRARQSLPAGLTPRETQVLQLVVAGKSNREVAEQLCLSESTVAKHLTSIFSKTGSDNRASAAAFAIRHGLD